MKKRVPPEWAVLLQLFVGVSGCAAADAAQPASSDLSTRVFERVAPTLRAELAKRDLQFGSPIFIRIFKLSGELELWVEAGDRFELFRTYRTCYFSGKLGPKLKEGDLQVPEGFYYVSPGSMNPWSSYHLSFNVGYPNRYDRLHGRTGSLIMVHGNCVSIGCVAMGDEQIEEIYTLATGAFQGGQPFFRVHIFPFRMDGEPREIRDMADPQDIASRLRNLLSPRDEERAAIGLIDGDWSGFWENLKEGYDYFEEHGVAPNVEVEKGRYIFDAP